MTFPGGESVTVLAPGPSIDPYSGETTYNDWKNPISQVVGDVLVGSGGSIEDTTSTNNIVDSDFDLIFQPPVTVTPTSANRIIVRGLTCNVVGRPFLWRWPTSGVEAGLVVKVQIREGG